MNHNNLLISDQDVWLPKLQIENMRFRIDELEKENKELKNALKGAAAIVNIAGEEIKQVKNILNDDWPNDVKLSRIKALMNEK